MARIVISNIPDGAHVPYIIDGVKRLMGTDVTVEQIPSDD